MAKIPIVTVVGYSNAGKTRCVVKLLSALTRRGYRIATAKHCHRGFDLDVKGKDTWKHKRAGAVTTLMSGRNQIGLVTDVAVPLSLGQMCEQYIHSADLLLAEGYSWEPFPKILVASRETLRQERITSLKPILAVVADFQLDDSLPHFSFAQLDSLASLVEERFLLAGQVGEELQRA